MTSTTIRDFNTLFGLETPALVNRTQTAAVILVEAIGAGVGDVKAFFFGSAPSGVLDEGHAFAVIIVGITTPWDFDAFVLLRVPSEASRADTFESLAVMVIGAVLRNLVAALCSSAPSESSLV